MAEMPEHNDEPGFIDNPHAPEVFADAFTGILVFNGVVRITFESVRVDHTSLPGPANRVVIGRLVMPAIAAEHMAKQFLGLITEQPDPPTASGPGTARVQ